MTKANNFQRIRELNYLQKAVLGGALLERMLPNYSLFSEATGFGDAAVFRSALSVCWEKILLPKSKISLEKQIEKIEPNVPELTDFDMFGTYPAIDTATALLGMLHGLIAKDEQNLNEKLEREIKEKEFDQQIAIDNEEINHKRPNLKEYILYKSDNSSKS